MIMKLSLSDLRVVTGELKVFYSSFGDFFRNRTRSVLKQAFQYLQGLGDGVGLEYEADTL